MTQSKSVMLIEETYWFSCCQHCNRMMSL